MNSEGPTELRAQIEALRRAHTQFREDVRKAVMRQYQDGVWCLPGSQEALRDLGLPLIGMRYEGHATIRVRIAEVRGAADRAEAVDRVIAALHAATDDDSVAFETENVTVSLETDVDTES
ncbi:hypothetical protein [Amycolatopsis tucumanensis]|uniref:Uncharacterized protein n=1 Tax=Amycolatopsis tucumanensis TaxID=401106 RepID=A0ABP7HIF1_9PSEU|nr:hypothetical protein [Amycolatopsis tucumanensis]MCF6423702.1 hypothetical protein [Amycolatopsis tucumanensis]